MHTNRITAEQVKELITAYQRQQHPEGRCCSAVFDCGPDQPPETLVVITSGSPCGEPIPAFPAGLVRNAS